jgi:protein SCO1/2
MRSTAFIFWVTVAIIGSAACGSWLALRNSGEGPRPHRHLAYDYPPAPPPGPPIKEFSLIERTGREFNSKELAGHVWIGSFFFCSCPGPCWQMNQALKGVEDEFKDSDLQLVSITCDPRDDTPEVLTQYANRLHADRGRWLFLTGDFDYIKRIGRDLFYQIVTESSHAKSAFAFDRNGRVRGSFDLTDAGKTGELKALVRQLLAEKAEPAGKVETSAGSQEIACHDEAESVPANKQPGG